MVMSMNLGAHYHHHHEAHHCAFAIIEAHRDYVQNISEHIVSPVDFALKIEWWIRFLSPSFILKILVNYALLRLISFGSFRVRHYWTPDMFCEGLKKALLAFLFHTVQLQEMEMLSRGVHCLYQNDPGNLIFFVAAVLCRASDDQWSGEL